MDNSTNMNKWEIEEDVRTLQRAAEIQRDSKRIKKALAEAKKQKNLLDLLITKK